MLNWFSAVIDVLVAHGVQAGSKYSNMATDGAQRCNQELEWPCSFHVFNVV